MARVLIVWELGEGYGHIGRLRRIAEAIEAKGHQTTYALRNLQTAGKLWEDMPGRLWQAPLPVVLRRNVRPSLTYSGMLATLGFDDANSLIGMLRGWLGLFDAIAPDLMIADHSPSAVLAARIAGLPYRAIGDGFAVPPPVAPTPSIQPWQQDDPARRAVEEAETLAGLNGALRHFGKAPLDRVTALFDAPVPLVCAFPETDHYPDRPDPGVRTGPVFMTGRGRVQGWAEREEPSLIAYLSGVDHGYDDMLVALKKTGLPLLLHLRDVRAGSIAEIMSGPNIYRSDAPIDLSWAARHANLIVCAGGIGTTSQALLAGTPLALMPQHSEQAMMAWRLKQRGIASVIKPGSDTDDTAARLKRWASSPEPKARAQALADSHRDFRVDAATREIAARCLAALPA